MIMLGKMRLMQKLERKIKENDDLHVTLAPMIELVKAEKNKLMIQRLEIESEMRKLGRDPPNADIDATALALDIEAVSISSNNFVQEAHSSSTPNHGGKSADLETDPLASTSAPPPSPTTQNCDVDLSLDSRLVNKSQNIEENEEEEEEEDDDDDDDDFDDDYETDNGESEEELNQDGVFYDAEDKKEETSSVWQQLDELLTEHRVKASQNSSANSP